MEWLNYHHLLYFWTVAREGGVSKAAAHLRLAQPTVSGQLRQFEDALGEQLFHRQGRRLVLTEMGRTVYRYADEIFTIGREMMDVIKGRPSGSPLNLNVGIADVVPKDIAYRLLEPALKLPEPVRMICREDKADQLLSELAVHELDVVISETPLSPGTGIRAFNHLLGECGMTFFATPALVAQYRKKFPQSLSGAPFVLPMQNTSLRRSLDQWFEAHDVRPLVVAEVEDSALEKVFGQNGVGIFASPSVIEAEIKQQFGVRVVGRVESIRARFYAISVERRLKNPAVVAISTMARDRLFG